MQKARNAIHVADKWQDIIITTNRDQAVPAYNFIMNKNLLTDTLN